MVVKFIIQAIFDLWGGVLFVQAKTLQDEFGVLYFSPILKGVNFLSVLLPAFQAVLIDVPIIWIIVINHKRLNKQAKLIIDVLLELFYWSYHL